MSHLNEIDDNINELIMSKSFDRLTDEEKARALEYVGTEEEYNSLRQTLLAITSSFNEENEEDFAQDEVKNDLMSQFEKKYGTGGNRTKIVPLYRKPYFQLAVAASLALIFFLTIPVLRQSDQNGVSDTQLAKTENTTAPTTGTNGSTAGENNVALGSKNRPDMGSAAAEQKEKEKLKTRDASPTFSMAEKSVVDEPVADKSFEKTVDVLSELKKEDGTNSNAYSWSPKEKEQEERNRATNTQKDLNQNVPVMPGKDAADNDEDYNKSDRKKQESQKNAPLRETVKEKTEYVSYGSDHTHDLMSGATIAAGNTNNVSSLSPGLTGFVEENKTEMLDLLFTVY
jgi:hypothetical protein